MCCEVSPGVELLRRPFSEVTTVIGVGLASGNSQGASHSSLDSNAYTLSRRRVTVAQAPLPAVCILTTSSFCSVVAPSEAISKNLRGKSQYRKP